LGQLGGGAFASARWRRLRPPELRAAHVSKIGQHCERGTLLGPSGRTGSPLLLAAAAVAAAAVAQLAAGSCQPTGRRGGFTCAGCAAAAAAGCARADPGGRPRVLVARGAGWAAPAHRAAGRRPHWRRSCRATRRSQELKVSPAASCLPAQLQRPEERKVGAGVGVGVGAGTETGTGR